MLNVPGLRPPLSGCLSQKSRCTGNVFMDRENGSVPQYGQADAAVVN
ncbi:MAG: hypothetical protein ACTFAL_03190 [Candidatus Electronema sp. V4]